MFRSFRLGRVCSAVLACAMMSPAAQAAPLDTATAARIDADVAVALGRREVPGAVIEIIRDGEPVYRKAYGLRDRARRLPAEIGTRYEIGSITKQFTAAAILQLRAAGKLDIDRKLATYLPAAPHAREVTLRQLLSHTSGLHEYFDDALASRPIGYDALIARIADLPLDFPPGSRFSYSNTGYMLLGRVIETLSGETYHDYLEHKIFGPLGMTRTATMVEEATLDNMAVGYRRRQGKLELAPPLNAGWAGAAGMIVGTPDDLAKWDAALSGGKVVSAADYAEMTVPFKLTGGASADYGLGLFVDSAFDQPRIGHTGGALGYTTADEFFPKQGVRIIAFTNSGDDTPEAGEVLTNLVFQDLYPDIATAALAPAAGEESSATDSARAAFVELQAGTGYAHFASSLAAKLANGAGRRLSDSLAP